MAYQALYRKYRPSKLEDVVGQQHIVNVLKNSISKKKISHAYLFCGPRGTGKTSLAKLFARAVNCEFPEKIICGTCNNCKSVADGTHPDLIEIDAASNNGVDEIRSLIDKVKYAPILGKYKVYIIDEVHMLSQGAFNALLKTLEEPPAHVVFILATTEIHKVIPTIISRCQRYDFNRIDEDSIAKKLDYVLENESVTAEQGVTSIIASLSGGGLRNALTILEQAIVLAEDTITVSQIYETNGLIDANHKIELFESIRLSKMDALVTNVSKISEKSVSYERFLMDLMQNLKDSIVYSYTKNLSSLKVDEERFVLYLANTYSDTERLKFIEIIITYADKMKFSQNQGIYFEVLIIEMFNEYYPKTNIKNLGNINIPDNHGTLSGKIIEEVVNEQRERKIDTPDHMDSSINLGLKLDQQEVITQNMDEQVVVSVSKKNTSLNNNTDDNESSDDLKEHSKDVLEQDNLELNETDVVRYMVAADKSLRFEDEKSFERLEQFKTDLKWARASRLLSGGKVVLSAPFFIVVSMPTDFEVREIREPRNKEELNNFSEVLLGSKRNVVAITHELYQNSVKMFIELNKTNSLPDPIQKPVVSMHEQLETKEETDESLEKVRELFGESLTIIE